MEIKDLKEILQHLDEKDIAEFELQDGPVKLRPIYRINSGNHLADFYRTPIT